MRSRSRRLVPNAWDNSPFFLWASRVGEIFKESVTYQEIVEEGVERGLKEGRLDKGREDILRIGTKRFGKLSRKIH